MHMNKYPRWTQPHTYTRATTCSCPYASIHMSLMSVFAICMYVYAHTHAHKPPWLKILRKQWVIFYFFIKWSYFLLLPMLCYRLGHNLMLVVGIINSYRSNSILNSRPLEFHSSHSWIQNLIVRKIDKVWTAFGNTLPTTSPKWESNAFLDFDFEKLKDEKHHH